MSGVKVVGRSGVLNRGDRKGRDACLPGGAPYGVGNDQ
jgi:hypothetical protein